MDVVAARRRVFPVGVDDVAGVDERRSDDMTNRSQTLTPNLQGHRCTCDIFFEFAFVNKGGDNDVANRNPWQVHTRRATMSIRRMDQSLLPVRPVVAVLDVYLDMHAILSLPTRHFH